MSLRCRKAISELADGANVLPRRWPVRRRGLLAVLVFLTSAAHSFGSGGGTASTQTGLDVHRFRVIERESGNINYYHVVEQAEGAILHGRYRPPLESVTLGMEMPEALRSKAKRLSWRWRVQAFPIHGNDCKPSLGDSAAAVFLTFKRGLKYYVIKYIWSTDAPKGAVCDSRRGMFYARDTVVLESGGTLNTWMTEEVDPRAEFLKHFEPKGSMSDVPDFVGIGVMTDGDQTHSIGEADYGFFMVQS